MSSYKSPDLKQRQSEAATAKKAMLDRFRSASEDPAVAQRDAARAALSEARVGRVAEREAAKVVRKAELAAQALRAAELVVQAERDAEKAEALVAAEKIEQEAALMIEQKATRDARYAARKAAKSVRRRGY